MNLEQKIGQMLFVGINGQTFSNSTQTILDTYNVGGIYLSNSNISDLATTKRFNEDLQKIQKSNFLSLQTMMEVQCEKFLGIRQIIFMEKGQQV